MSHRGVMSLSLVPTLARELFSTRTMPRVPEPEVMNGAEQVAAYERAGSTEGMVAMGQSFHAARITQVVQGCKRVLDLGCGPGTQLCEIAALNPATEFIGLDLSREMLDRAQACASVRGLRNVRFRQMDISRLDGLEAGSVDGVLSTMTLHHLPSHNDLARCFASIARVLEPGGAIYLADFVRLKSSRSVEFFMGLLDPRGSAQLMSDFAMSMRAAFEREELKALSDRYLVNTTFYSTFGVSFLAIIKTPDRPISNEVRARIQERRQELCARDRRDLDGLRYFMLAGGLRNDPYGGVTFT